MKCRTPIQFRLRVTVDMRVLGHFAATAGLYRLEQLIAVLAQKTLWLTDAYFVGTTSYVQALRGAAMDDVDVRLLVPGSSGDLKFLRPISRAGYRPLLEAGVRVFEWNGSMLHAKTAVADGRWARVGSSNLNMASWLGNWELDVAVENLGFAHKMEQMYLQDLDNATEIVLREKDRVRPVAEHRLSPEVSTMATGQAQSGSAGRLTAGAIRGRQYRRSGHHQSPCPWRGRGENHVFRGPYVAGTAMLALLEPLLMVIPFSLLAGWFGVSLLIQAYSYTRTGKTVAHPMRHPTE